MEGMLKEAAANHGLGYTIVRFPDFYGPYIVNGFTEQLLVNASKGNRSAGSAILTHRTTPF